MGKKASRFICVSEIVGVILATLIVIAVGSLIVAKMRENMGSWNSAAQNLQERGNLIKNEPYFEVIYSYVNLTGKYIAIYLNVAPGDLTISSIYLNGNMISDSFSQIYIDGVLQEQIGTSGMSLNGPNVHEIKVFLNDTLLSSIESSKNALLKIISKSGMQESFSSMILGS
ncbi:MAG: hypothetical protein GU347_00710 [Desulfurococcales archaeon]|jgi:hypothetical protein|nr:hypothetical protein [Desulfurococcales archaeon]